MTTTGLPALPAPDTASPPAGRRARPCEIDIAALARAAECPPVSENVLALWDPGLRAAARGAGHVIDILGVIGEDWLTGEGVTSKDVARVLAAAGGGSVEVRINSPGGDMFEGVSIYNLLAQHGGHVQVTVTGLAASAASVIAMAGDRIVMGQGAFLMIHNCWVMATGDRHDLAEAAAFLAPFDTALRDIYAARTGQDAQRLEAWMDAETMFTAGEAVAHGFADAVLPDSSIVRDARAADAARVFNAARVAESRLCRKSGLTRSAARALISELKGMPGAARPATQDAGDTEWMDAARAFVAALSA